MLHLQQTIPDLILFIQQVCFEIYSILFNIKKGGVLSVFLTNQFSILFFQNNKVFDSSKLIISNVFEGSPIQDQYFFSRDLVVIIFNLYIEFPLCGGHIYKCTIFNLISEGRCKEQICWPLIHFLSIFPLEFEFKKRISIKC